MSTTNNTTPLASFGATSAREPISCRVCGRFLLMGERSVGYFTATGEGPWDVCELCVGRAAQFGLRRHPSTADEVARAGRGNHVARMLDSIRGSLGRTSGSSRRRRAGSAAEVPVVQGSAAVAAQAAAQASRRGPSLRRRRTTLPADIDYAALTAVPVGTAAIPMALAAFNQSPHARTLAGLYRTLGAPRASVQPRSATDREVIITVAWEIVWYQFRVMPDGIEPQRGTYLSELQSRWQAWNCDVHTDGTVHEAQMLVPTDADELGIDTQPEGFTQ